MHLKLYPTGLFGFINCKKKFYRHLPIWTREVSRETIYTVKSGLVRTLHLPPVFPALHPHSGQQIKASWMLVEIVKEILK